MASPLRLVDKMLQKSKTDYKTYKNMVQSYIKTSLNHFYKINMMLFILYPHFIWIEIMLRLHLHPHIHQSVAMYK